MSRKPRRHPILALLLDLRAEGISCTTVTVGGVTLEGVIDSRRELPEQPKRPAEPRVSMWDQQVEALKNLPADPKADVPPETLID